MKNILVVILVSIISTPVAAASEDKDALRQLKLYTWPQAYKTQDAELLGSILHPSFELIDASGNLSNRDKEMDFVRKNKWNPPGFKYTIERLDIYGGKFAIISGSGNSDNYSYKSSNVLIKENGKWQAVSSHVSGFEEK